MPELGFDVYFMPMTRIRSRDNFSNLTTSLLKTEIATRRIIDSFEATALKDDPHRHYSLFLYYL